MPVETLESLAELEPSYVPLTEAPAPEQTALAREKSENYLYENGAHSGGKRAGDVLSIIKEATDKLRSESTEAKVKYTVANVRGVVAEMLSKKLEPSECETVYKLKEFLPASVAIDPYDYYIEMGGLRKDAVLVNNFFETRAQEILPKESETGYLTGDEVNTLKKDTITALVDYENIEKKMNVRNTGRDQLIRWHIQNQGHLLSGKKGKTQNKLLSEALSVTDKRDTTTLKTLIENHAEPAYVATTLPDEFLEDTEGKIIGVIEVKAYTPSEVKDWTNALKLSMVQEFNTFGLSEQEKNDRAADAALYDRRGSQVNILGKDMRPTGMRLGVNFEGLRYFINVANNEAPHSALKVNVDLINDETAEVIQKEVDFEYPIIVRLPQDIPNEDILELGSVLEKLNISNIAIQKLPFTSREINEKGFGIYHRFGDTKEMERLKRSIDPSVTSALNRRSAWVE